MKFDLTLYVQRHADSSHTVRVVEFPEPAFEDPRTGLELATVYDVLEGDLDPFVLAFLRSETEEGRGSKKHGA